MPCFWLEQTHTFLAAMWSSPLTNSGQVILRAPFALTCSDSSSKPILLEYIVKLLPCMQTEQLQPHQAAWPWHSTHQTLLQLLSHQDAAELLTFAKMRSMSVVVRALPSSLVSLASLMKFLPSSSTHFCLQDSQQVDKTAGVTAALEVLSAEHATS